MRFAMAMPSPNEFRQNGLCNFQNRALNIGTSGFEVLCWRRTSRDFRRNAVPPIVAAMRKRSLWAMKRMHTFNPPFSRPFLKIDLQPVKRAKLLCSQSMYMRVGWPLCIPGAIPSTFTGSFDQRFCRNAIALRTTASQTIPFWRRRSLWQR